jgi:hypothetical protein
MKPKPLATITRRAAQIVNLTPGLSPDMSRAIRAYPPINGRCQCRRVFWADGWRDSGEPPFSADGARLATIRE